LIERNQTKLTNDLKYSSNLFSFFCLLFLCTGVFALYTEAYLIAAIPFIVLICYAAWQQSAVSLYLLLFSISFSIEFQFSTSLGTDIPDEPLMLLVSFIFLAYWLYYPSAISKKLWQHPIFLLLLLCVGWSVIAALFSSHTLISFKYLLAKTWYIGAFLIAPLILFKNENKIRKASVYLTVGIVAAAFIALVRHYPYQFRFAFINDALQPFFRNHVNYAALLVCSVPLLLGSFQLSKTQKQKLLISISLLIVLTALFFSYSRGAWLALLAGVLSYWLIKKKLLIASYIAAILIVLASVFWLRQNDHYLKYANDFKTTIFHKNFSEHIIATYKLKDVSTAERFYRWVAGARMIKDNAAVGFGPGTFYYHYKSYGLPAFKTWVSDNEDHSTVHNYFLLTAIEQGIPGLVFLLFLFGCLLYYAQYLYHRTKILFYKTTSLITGILVVMILSLNLLSDLIETDKIGSIFFLCMAVLIATDINTRKQQPSDFPSHI